MKDNFDLKKFLKENKSLENLNPTFKSLNENKSVKEKIKEMILAELNETNNLEEYIDEAKKDEEVEDVETTDVETTDTTEEPPAEEAPTEEKGLENIAADMEGTEGDLMDALMKAFKIAKGMNNEKLETQVGNTLKFFVSEYIGGGDE